MPVIQTKHLSVSGPEARSDAGRTRVSIADVLSSLSHALDLTEGHPRGHAVRTALIGLRIGELAGIPDAEQTDLLYALLLKDAGCSANASRVYQLFGGSDHEVKRAVWTRDWRKITEQARYVLGWTERGGSWTAKLRKLIRLARIGPEGSRELFQLRCDRGAEIARLMDLGGTVAEAIHCMDEHWDGGGYPAGLAGDDIPMAAQIIGLAQVLEIFWGRGGAAEALAVARSRSGTWFNPRLVGTLRRLESDAGFWRGLEVAAGDGSGSLLGRIPESDGTEAADDDLDRIAAAFALIIDGKSPYTGDHSRRVAHYAVEIGRRLDLTDAEVVRLRRAALVHDLGKLAVPNAILDKPGALDEREWAEIRKHPALTLDILKNAPGFQDLAMDAANHHERIDGTGYHLGLDGSALSKTARVLAVSDVMDALAAERPYRDAMPAEKVVAILESDAGSHFCPACVEVCTPDLVGGAR